MLEFLSFLCTLGVLYIVGSAECDASSTDSDELVTDAEWLRELSNWVPLSEHLPIENKTEQREEKQQKRCMQRDGRHGEQGRKSARR